MARPVGGTLSEAFRRVYERAGVSQLDIAEALDVDQPTVSKWARGMRKPPLDALPVVEQLCGVPLGTILREAGYVADNASVTQAIAADPTLDADDRRSLIRFYEFLSARSAASVAS